MSDNIPPYEIQLEIIKKVRDVKSLIRFRAVSKPWKSFIDSSEFITGYGARSTQPHRLLLRKSGQPIMKTVADRQGEQVATIKVYDPYSEHLNDLGIYSSFSLTKKHCFCLITKIVILYPTVIKGEEDGSCARCGARNDTVLEAYKGFVELGFMKLNRNPWLRTQEGEVRSLSPSQSMDESTRQKKKKKHRTEPPQGDELTETNSQEHREEKGGRTKPNEQSNHIEEDLEPTLLMAILEDEEEQKVSLHEEDVGYKETNTDSLWYLDNGASNHMTGIREHFKELDEKVSGKVRFEDGSCIKIKGKGSILIGCDDEKQRIISHVYYILDLKSNLLSLGQFIEIGYKVVMEDDELRLYDKDNKIFMKVTRQRNRLYKANLRILLGLE
nr:zinc finger, CCHC-type [Tanacetum cinerariifolium]